MMPLNRETGVNCKNDNPINTVTVRKSENVTITLKTVVNMFNRKLPLIKTNKEIHPFLRRVAWEKRFLNEEKFNDKDKEKIILKEEVKELQEQCMVWQNKSKTNDDELLKLKHKINMLEEEREKLQNKLKQVELDINEYKKRNSHFQELINYQKEINAMGYCIDSLVQEINHSRNPIGNATKMKNIFKEVNNGHRNVFISGKPGFFKSVLCMKIAYDVWTNENSSENYLSHFDFVILVTLMNVGDESVPDAALEAIYEYESSYEESTIQFIRKYSFDISGNMTILLTNCPHVSEGIREIMHSQFIL
ncbi:uncharacterized protein LOC111615995, partial [Centruroides sculpturatus]|uniref:uncharacterized protein LOC111615995 n=1 Tax=Centruroides sculpturatus TaxID=218467 RepID=UPI000C6E68B4